MELYFLVLLIALLAVGLASGFPVAFTLPGTALLTIGLAALAGATVFGDTSAFFYEGGPAQWVSAGVSNFRGLYWAADRDTLIAIPLFIFMGVVLQRSKIAEDLLMKMAQLFGPVPGGLGISVIFVGALLAATTGIIGATVVAMGLISLPAMLRNGYSQALSTGTIAASGTLGQIIPPSIVLIILADQLSNAVERASNTRAELYKDATGELMMPSSLAVSSTSAGEMFLGALIPGLVLVAIYMLSVMGYALLRRGKAPPVPAGGDVGARFWVGAVATLVPPLALIFLVLGSIIMGVATVSQAGAIGAVGTIIMAGYRLAPGRRSTYLPLALAVASVALILVALQFFDINSSAAGAGPGLALAFVGSAGLIVAVAWSGWRLLKTEDVLRQSMLDTAKTSAMVFVILMGAAMLTAAFRAFGGEDYVHALLGDVPGGFWVKFAVVMAVIFVLGFFLEFIEIAVVVVPIVAPILLADPAANVTAVWLGVMIGINLQTSFLTPPFGFALFYLRGVAPPEVSTKQIYRGVVPFIGLQLLALGIIALVPTLVNYTPTRLQLASDMAPPPTNPALQYCLRTHVLDDLAHHEDELRAALDRVEGLPIGRLPKNLAADLSGSVPAAREALKSLEEARAARADLTVEAESFRPLHREVLTIKTEIRQLESMRETLSTQLRRSERTEAFDSASLEARVMGIENRIATLEGELSATHSEAEAAYREIEDREASAWRRFERSAQDAYEPAQAAAGYLDDAPRLAKLARSIEAQAEGAGSELASTKVAALIERARDLSQTDDLVNRLREAEDALDASDSAEAIAAMREAARQAADNLEVRRGAAAEVGQGLTAYEAALRPILGLRSLDRLPPEAAEAVAWCRSGHRDVSLSF